MTRSVATSTGFTASTESITTTPCIAGEKWLRIANNRNRKWRSPAVWIWAYFSTPLGMYWYCLKIYQYHKNECCCGSNKFHHHVVLLLLFCLVVSELIIASFVYLIAFWYYEINHGHPNKTKNKNQGNTLHCLVPSKIRILLQRRRPQSVVERRRKDLT